jgi:Histidine kinase-, DNA gyrase B-, and HSP90-like ATPase.
VTQQTAQDLSRERAQLLPTKDTLKALKSDVTLESACLELCDNSIDAWRRNNNQSGPAHLEIFTVEKDDRTELVIRDDTGGVPREDSSMLFGLGQTAKGGSRGLIGTFGVGAKKSLVNLGIPFRIRSRHFNEDEGWTYRITEDWFEDDTDWSVPIDPDNKIESGTTEIRIEDLNYNWTDENTESLCSALGRAYNCFLSDEFQKLRGTAYDLEITVNGNSVEPEGLPEWSYTPFDDLSPRRYQNIQIEHPDSDEPISLSITVGLLKKKTAENVGTDIYCQQRKIASSLRNEVGGFGNGPEGIGKFMARHERLKVIVELETEADGRLLPWDTQKSAIDRYNPIMRGTESTRGVYNWLRRAVEPYYILDADKVPRAFVEPYDSDHPHASNNGSPIVHNYQGRKRIVANHRPNTDLPETKSIHDAAIAHAALRIRCDSFMKDSQRPAYELQLQTECETDISTLSKPPKSPPDPVVKEPFQTVGQIKELARCHISAGLMYTDEFEGWEKPVYQQYIEQNTEKSLEPVHTLPDGVPGTIDTLGKTVEHQDLSTDYSNTVSASKKTVSEDRTDDQAEIYLVLGRNSDEEKVAKIMECNRKEISKALDLSSDTADEVVWEELKHHLESLVDE